MRWMLLPVLFVIGCNRTPEVQSVSGVKMATVGEIHLNPEGKTIEQENLVDRIKADNSPGAVKHLYVISAYSGQTIMYSPVRGKVTSGGKRLTPRRIDGVTDGQSRPMFKVGDKWFISDEVPGEDGTYGTSDPYIFWFTPDGVQHQHFLGGGQIVHISDRPLAVKSVTITIEGGK